MPEITTNLKPTDTIQLEGDTYEVIQNRLSERGRKIFPEIESFINEAKNVLKDNLLGAFLFGSVSRGQETEQSDIDILILVKQYDYKLRLKISKLTSAYSLTNDLLISPLLKDQINWEKNHYHNTLLYQEIRRDGIQLC